VVCAEIVHTPNGRLFQRSVEFSSINTNDRMTTTDTCTFKNSYHVWWMDGKFIL